MTAALAGLCLAVAVLLLPGRRRPPPPAAPGGGRVAGRGADLPAGGRPRTDVAAVAGELATLTRGGLPVPVAWAAVAQEAADDEVGRLLVRVAAAAGTGAPVGDLLAASAATRHGADGGRRPPLRWPARGRRRAAAVRRELAALAATVRVQEATGAPVADLLDRAAAGLRADADAELARRAALAAPLATARVLVALPPAGLLLGVVVGADPVSVLMGTDAGRVSTVVGLAAAVAGWWWSRRLVRLAAPRSRVGGRSP